MSINHGKEQKVWNELSSKTKQVAHDYIENHIVKEGRAFSTTTGEEITDKIHTGINVIDKQVRRLQETDELSRHQIENGGFIFALFKQSTSIKERFPTLSKPDIARLMYIVTFTAWETGRLQSENGKEIYTKKDLSELIGMSKKRFNEFFRKLKNENIIQETKETGEIFINPSVFYRGNLKNHGYDISEYQYTRLFRKTVHDLYKQFQGRRLGQLANIYAVLPFLNFDTNIICHNPTETSEDLIRPMTLQEVSKMLEYGNDSKLKAALNDIKIDNKPVFGFFEDPHNRRQLRIVINPRIVFAGNGESLKAIKALFN